MKIYTASRDYYEFNIKYTVRASSEEKAEMKIFAMCGQHLKIKEV